MTLHTRPMTADDVAACVAILNPIIARGGTTAYEEPFDAEHFTEAFLHQPPVTHVVEDAARVLGFQVASDIGKGLYSIATFTDRDQPVKGAGRALFEATLTACRARGGDAIMAYITSDNTGALAYYGKMGFVEDHILPNDVTRKCGTTVNRVAKRHPL